MVKKTYKISGMHCTSCAMLIEGELEDAGMTATCSYAKQIVEVEVEESNDVDLVVKQAVEKAGYSLRD